MRKHERGFLLTAVVFSIAILLAVEFLTFRTAGELLESRDDVEHTYTVLGKVNALQGDVKDLEAAERGYLLTGEERFLDRYAAALPEIEWRLAELRALLSDNPSQLLRLDRLEPLVEARLSDAAEQIDLWREAGPGPAAQRLAEGLSTEVTDEIRELTREIVEAERSLLAGRVIEAERRARLVRGMILGGTWVAILLLLGVGVALTREMLRRSQAEASLRDVNRELDRRVADRTADLQETTRQLQRVLERQREVETRLRNSEDRHTLAMRGANEVLWDYWAEDPDRYFVSDRFTAVVGVTLENPPYLSAQEWKRRIHREDLARHEKNWQAHLDGKTELYICEYRVLDDHGRYRWVLDRGAGQRGDNGQIYRVAGSLGDVTGRKEAEEALLQAQKMEAVGQLTGGVAHDFNNLLTVILGNAELLAEELTGDQRLRVMAEMTRSAAERGSELTQRLLAFSRRQALEPEVFDANRLILDVEALLRRALPDDIQIETTLAGGLWRCKADVGQLEAALMNLALNARDAMPGGGKLTIETANSYLDAAYAEAHSEVRPGQYVLVAVTDTGQGMPPAVVERAFEPFFTTKEIGKGSGLGLSMVFGFVKQSGGHIKIYSEVGHGTTVKLYLPRTLGSEVARLETTEAQPLPGGRECILVVEDDPLVRGYLVDQLRNMGYAVIEATNGPEALAKLESGVEVDLLFTDVVMPGGMNGRELAQRAVRNRPDLKVLFTSGYTENAIVHQGKLDPGVHLLNKPYRKQDMARKVRAVLEDDRSHQQLIGGGSE